jgi:hypothetical protein
MARKVTGGLSGSPSVGALNVAPTAVVTAADDQNITLSPSGTGSVVITNNAILNAQSDLRFGDADSSNWVAFQGPSTVASNVTWTLPATDGSSDQVLTTNASGTLSWSSKSVAISDETSSSSTYYPLITTTTSGTATAANVSTTKMTFQPSTGLLAVEGTVRSLLQENIQTASYTLALTDRSRVVLMNNTAAATVTVPANSSVAFPTGSVIYIGRYNTGTVTLAAAVGVTLSKTGLLASYEEIFIRKRATDSWAVFDGPTAGTGTASGGTVTTSAPYTISTFTTTGAATYTVA